MRDIFELFRWLCALALLQLAATPASGECLSERLLGDARDGRLDDFDFLSAALIASGSTDACELAGWLDSYHLRRGHLLATIPAVSPRERLEAIHAELHELVLTGKYRTAATDVRLALTDGDFNCLSSLALYFDLCQAADLNVEICLARGHVFVRAESNGQAATIEPGCLQWSSRDNWRPAAARRLTPVELLGKFYYNRGVELVKERRFAEGIELLEASLELDPADGDARANLAAGLNNWAVELFQESRYDEAAALIEQGLLLDSEFAPLVANKQLVQAKLGE